MTHEYVSAEREVVEDVQQQEKIANEEFKIWKKSVPLLYDTIHTNALEYPSLVVQWLPNYTYSENKNLINVKYLIGTNSNDHNYLKLGSIDLPSTLAPDFASVLPNALSIPIPLSNIETSNFRILSKWKQPSEINRLRLSPDGDKALTFNSNGIIHSYNLVNNDILEYNYHKQEGYGLEWISNEAFLSGSKDSQIALWNILKPSTPIQLFKNHKGGINDLSVNSISKDIFGSVSDDFTTQFHDIRVAGEPVIQVQNSHIQSAIDFHPDVQTLYSTAGKDNTVNLYDLRNPETPIRRFFGHSDTVIGVKWDLTNDPNVLVSWGLDKRVIYWDLANLEEDFVYPNSESENSKRKNSSKVDPCLKFIHAGHTNRINDLDIHPSISNLYATVGEDRLFEVWKPKTLLAEDENEEEESEKEEKEEEKNE
ncbi:WD40 repeat-like protein [Suhomyces tanzawaensis NRRL Y-17324]|uniref:WD40 repeat-like protein n=1 Tax=Suhomyces tanzawaensis NRRL Y-17324 TaxID=984487 RepID=A0A1E4SH92_9ASCO|nr:WD40 repeat-like protein [Suhomyces tanzawaensis NRRL Y-17324]ODV78840.1 WD40 repeat-like protein [Suhomyces tanzawaensis NRRL Y-17324]